MFWGALIESLLNIDKYKECYYERIKHYSKYSAEPYTTAILHTAPLKTQILVTSGLAGAWMAAQRNELLTTKLISPTNLTRNGGKLNSMRTG